MTAMLEFRAWPKTPRLFGPMTITEKIDGTNGCVVIHEDGSIGAQTRKRSLPMAPRGMDDTRWEKEDNHGFGAWVRRNKDTLTQDLGHGYHYGEWWGHRIQRGYGCLPGQRHFSLFNTGKWGTYATEGFFRTPDLGVVPVLYEGEFDMDVIKWHLSKLRTLGSEAAPGFKNPEGICVYHHNSGQIYKVPFEGEPKSKAAWKLPPADIAAVAA